MSDVKCILLKAERTALLKRILISISLNFKVDASADEAVKQINEKVYGNKYKSDHRKIYTVGINFSSEKRNIDEWKME